MTRGQEQSSPPAAELSRRLHGELEPGSTVQDDDDDDALPDALPDARREALDTDVLLGSDSIPEPSDASTTGVPLGAEPIRLRPGETVPGTRYRIVRWLGEGTSGVVYEAQHVDIERRAALKVLRADKRFDPKATTAFRGEARTASRIGSEHIVEIYDFAKLTDGRLVIAMEMASDGSLAPIAHKAPIDAGLLIGLLRQICKALTAAHAVGIVHRDIKPDNVLLVENEGRLMVKVADFGIASLVDQTVAGAGTIAGSPAYMAPEQIDCEPFDGRADLYALGCTAYELVRGQPPFVGRTVPDVFQAKTSERPEHVDRDESRLPRALSAVIMKCLEPRPEDRFASVIELEAALCEAQIEAGITTDWDHLPAPEVEPARRERIARHLAKPAPTSWRWPLVAAGLLVLALALALMIALQPTATVADLGRVDALAIEARAAAAKSFFVYPPREDPTQPTAFQKVLELEQLEQLEQAQAGPERAQLLRREMSDTLARLGDRYWDQDGGRKFATDYYAQALVFMADHEAAGRRILLTPGELVVLRDKAANGAFTDHELEAAEVLVVLADQNDDRRIAELERLLAQANNRAASTDASLTRLARGSPAHKRPRRAAEPSPTEETKPAAGDDVAPEQPVDEQGAAADDASDSEPPVRRDPKQARKLVREAKAALRAKKPRRAESLLHRALEHKPNYAPALMALSDLRFEQGDYSEAVAFGKRAVRAAPKNASYRLRLGDAYVKTLRYREARTHYQKAEALGAAGAAERLRRLQSKLSD